MNAKTSADNEFADFSIVLGGPLYQLYLRSRLARPPIELLHRRVIVMVLIAWLPLALLSIIEGHAISGVKVPFLQHLAVHCRFLLALPLLIAAEVIAHKLVGLSVQQFLECKLIPADYETRFENAIASAMRLRNSAWLEVLFLIIAFTAGYWLWKQNAMQAESWYLANPETMNFTAAGYWYAFLSLPIFRFILLRWYFRLFILYRFLWQVSRMQLHLNALHPDRAGGLGFLNSTAFALLPVLLAQTILLSGTIGDFIWHEGASLPQFRLEIAIIIVLLVILAFLPQVFFIFQLYRTRLIGRLEFGVLADRYVDNFHQKWIRDGKEGEKDVLLGSADIQSLADLGNSSNVIEEMRLVPFTLKTFVKFALTLIVPMLPLLLTMIPLNEMLDRLLKLLL